MAETDWQSDDFSWVRGANYVPTYARNDIAIWNEFDADVIDRELGYAERAGINSVRVFFQIIVYERDPALYMERFETFLHLCEKRHIRMMPVLFDSCFGEEPSFEAEGWVANPGNARVSQETWPGCEKYVDDVVGNHLDDARIAIWDIMNEPMVAGEFTTKEENKQKVWRFVRHICQYVNHLDPSHATTVGIAWVDGLEQVADVERVLSFHSYSADEKKHRGDIRKAKRVGKEQGKPVVVSETGHYALGQSYEFALRVCREESIGWYIWELMIGIDPFPAVQGVFYPDGTIRSADDLCAVLGYAKKEFMDGVFTARSFGEEEFQSCFKEALSTPTAEWNLERRLGILHSIALVDCLVIHRMREDKPEITMDDIRKRIARGDREDARHFAELRHVVLGELTPQLDVVREPYRQGDRETAYRKLDELLDNFAAKIGFSSG